MNTEILILEDYKKTGEISDADLTKIRKAARILAAGGLVAFPTETVYGLGGDARRADVSARIYAAKGRPSDNPLIVHISCLKELEPLARRIPETCRKLASSYWPGPMTLVMEKTEMIPPETTGGLDTVAVRMPVHPVAAKLIELAGVPVAAPSANRSGRPSTTTAEHCMEDLDGRVDLILDGGPCDIGVESTILDLTQEEPVLLRPGAVTMEMLAKTLGKEPQKDKALLRALKEGEKPKAPGMKYRHYAPRAPLVVVRPKNSQCGCSIGRQGCSILTGNSGEGVSYPMENVYRRIAQLAEEYLSQGLTTEIICTQECADWFRKNAGEQGSSLAPEKQEGVPAERNAEETNLRGQEPVKKISDKENAEEMAGLAMRKTCRNMMENVPLRVLGKREDSLKISQNLFAELRDTDADRVDRLIAEGFEENDLFLAIMNRLKKAAGWKMEEV